MNNLEKGYFTEEVRMVPSRRAFTLIEVVIVIALIAILSVVVIPSIVRTAEQSKQDLIDLANGKTDTVYILSSGEPVPIFDKDKYEIVSTEVKHGTVYVTVKEKSNGID